MASDTRRERIDEKSANQLLQELSNNVDDHRSMMALLCQFVKTGKAPLPSIPDPASAFPVFASALRCPMLLAYE